MRRGGSRPVGAACSSRAAVLTASPVTNVWPLRRVAGDDLARVDPGPEADDVAVSGTELASSAASCVRIAAAARTARSASSSWTTGTPNTAITASPMNFSTVPPCDSMIRFMTAK